MSNRRTYTLLSLGLKRHHNFKEYWVCGTCGQRKRHGRAKNLKRCKRCGATQPQRIRLRHRERGEGDRANEDAKKSKAMSSAAAKARKGLRYGTNTFPPSNPYRELLDAAIVYEPNPKNKSWVVQTFTSSGRFLGESDREMCLTAVIEEVVSYMSERKMMQIRISDDMHKWLKMYAAQNSTTMTEVVLMYLRRLRDRTEKKVKVDQI